MGLFSTIRTISYIAVILASAVVLGLAANFANLFLPHIHRPFTIFSVIVPSVTILVFLMVLFRSQPRADAAILFVLIVLWLTLAAWSEDVIGHVECFSLSGTQPTKTGTMSMQQYCYEMKAIEAFSWAIFSTLMICMILLISLVSRVMARGRYHAWEESMSELPWFGQFNVPYGNYGGGQPYPVQYAGGGQPMMINQAPGHSLVIQPSANGGPPMVQQIQGTVHSMA